MPVLRVLHESMDVILIAKIIRCLGGNWGTVNDGPGIQIYALTTLLLCFFFSPQSHTQRVMVKLVCARECGSNWKQYQVGIVEGAKCVLSAER